MNCLGLYDTKEMLSMLSQLQLCPELNTCNSQKLQPIIQKRDHEIFLNRLIHKNCRCFYVHPHFDQLNFNEVYMWLTLRCFISIEC